MKNYQRMPNLNNQDAAPQKLGKAQSHALLPKSTMTKLPVPKLTIGKFKKSTSQMPLTSPTAVSGPAAAMSKVSIEISQGRHQVFLPW